jgi:hypothetical protein
MIKANSNKADVLVPVSVARNKEAMTYFIGESVFGLDFKPNRNPISFTLKSSSNSGLVYEVEKL